MNTIKNQTKKGFTIIEVVLVLAIAGLIFLMVFLALPALQRSQRDTQRKQDASRFLTAVNDWKAANRGRVPTADDFNDIITRYITVQGSTFNDPATGEQYTSGGDVGQITYDPSGQCPGAGGDVNRPTVTIALEGSTEGYCIE